MYNSKEFEELQGRECEAFYLWSDMPNSELKDAAKAKWLKAKAELEEYARKHGLIK